MKTDTRIRMEAAIKTILKEGWAVKQSNSSKNSSKKIVKEAGGLKLYVWQGFGNDYTEGLAFAIASSEEEAKQLVLNYIGLEDNPDTDYKFDDADWGELTVHNLSTPIAGAVFGGG